MKPPTKIIRILALVLIGIQINGCGTFMATELHCLSGCSRVYLATRTDIHVLSLVFSDDLETPNNCISCCFNVSAQDFPSSSLKDSNVVEAGVHLFLFGLSLPFDFVVDTFLLPLSIPISFLFDESTFCTQQKTTKPLNYNTNK